MNGCLWASISFRCKIPHKVTLSFEAYSDYFAGAPKAWSWNGNG